MARYNEMRRRAEAIVKEGEEVGAERRRHVNDIALGLLRAYEEGTKKLTLFETRRLVAEQGLPREIAGALEILALGLANHTPIAAADMRQRLIELVGEDYRQIRRCQAEALDPTAHRRWWRQFQLGQAEEARCPRCNESYGGETQYCGRCTESLDQLEHQLGRLSAKTIELPKLEDDEVAVITVQGGQLGERTLERLRAYVEACRTGEQGPHAMVFEGDTVYVEVTKVKREALDRDVGIKLIPATTAAQSSHYLNSRSYESRFREITNAEGGRLMKTHTIETMAEDVAAVQSDIDAEWAKGAAKGESCPGFLLPLFKAGHWLHQQILEEGGTDQDGNEQTFALGQRCRMGGSARNAYRLAIEQLERWRSGHADRPGLELAKSLIDAVRDESEQCENEESEPD